MGTLTPGLPNCTKFNRRFESGTASPAQAASLPYSEKTRSLEIATFRRHTYLHPAAEAIKRWGKLPYCKDGYKAQRDKRTRSILRHVPDDLKIGDRIDFGILAIAYGLSYAPVEFPTIFRPPEVEPLHAKAAVANIPDRDELYPK